MKYINHKGEIRDTEDSDLAIGTSLRGELDISYQKLVETFGEPKKDFEDGSKVDAEWILLTPEGIATIYNYKTGKNYLGEDGEDIKDIRDWHVGGHSKNVVYYINRALEK